MAKLQDGLLITWRDKTANKQNITLDLDAGGQLSSTTNDMGTGKDDATYPYYKMYRDNTMVTTKIVAANDSVYIYRNQYVDTGNIITHQSVIRYEIGDIIVQALGRDYEVKYSKWASVLNIKPNHASNNFTSLIEQRKVLGSSDNTTTSFNGFDISGKYSIDSGALDVTEAMNNATTLEYGTLTITLTGIDIKFIQETSNFDVVAEVYLNDKLVPNPYTSSNELETFAIPIYYDDKVTIIVDAGENIVDWYTSGQLVVKVNLKIINSVSESLIDESNNDTVFYPVQPSDQNKSYFTSLSGEYVAPAWYAARFNRLYYVTNELNNTKYTTTMYNETNKYDLYSSTPKYITDGGGLTDTVWFSFTSAYDFGHVYTLRTDIQAALVRKSYKSITMRLTGDEYLYNIQKVSVKHDVIDKNMATVTGEYYAPIPPEIELSTGQLDPIFSNGNAVIRASFTLIPTAEFILRLNRLCPIETVNKPTDIYLIALRKDSKAYKLFYDTLGGGSHNRRSTDDLLITPNSNRDVGQNIMKVIDDLSIDPLVEKDGMVYSHSDFPFDPIQAEPMAPLDPDGQEYNINVPIYNNDRYKLLLVISANVDPLLRSSYTTYDLSYIPNQGDNITQFDMEVL